MLQPIFHLLAGLGFSKLSSKSAPTIEESNKFKNSSHSYIYSLGKAIWMDRNYRQFAEEAYTKNVIAYRAINMVAHSAASIPIKLQEIIGGNGEIKRVYRHPILDLIATPNPMQNGKELLESLYISR